MKKNIVKLICLSFMIIGTISCSSDDSTVKIEPNPNDPENPNPNPNPNPTATKYVHKVLLEDITGTWCPACPVASAAIKSAKENAANGDKVVAAVIHIGQSSYPDPMQISAGSSLYSSYFMPNYGEGGSFYFPTVAINRGPVAWQQQGLAQFFNAINQDGSSVGIKISSDLTTTGGTVNADFKFSEGYQNLKYNVYVIEQSVVTSSPQAGTNEGANYVHYDVLRAISGTVTGNTLGNVTADQEVAKADQSVTYTLFNNDLSKVEVVVFVTDNSGKVLNVQKAKANETVDYQMMN